MELEEIVRPFERRATGIRFTGQGAPDQYASYHELAGLGVGFANALRRAGVELGEPVGLVLANDKSSVVAMLGCWIAGSPVVSIPPAGRGIGADLYCEGFSAVLDQVPCRTVFGPGRAQGSLLPTIRFFDTESFVGRLEASTADPLVPIPDQALIQFTSGSTSLPRGVVLQKDTVVGHLDMLYDALELTGHDPAVSWLPLHHDMGLIGFFMVPLMTRGPLTLMDPLSFIRNPLRWLDECAAEHATITGAPNFGYRLATRALKRSTVRRDLRDIRLCLAGAERISATALREFAEAAAPDGFDARALMPVYGLAEATLGACFPAPHCGLSEGPVDTVSVGQPVPGMEIRLREPDSSGRGHLDIRGRWLLDEYITADGRVQPRDDDGWFRTSDVAMRKGDDLFVIGRSDEVVISRGANVYAEDLEGLAIRIAGDEGFVAAAFRPSIEAQSFVVIIELALRHPNAPDTLAADVRSAIVGNLGVEVEEVLVCKPRTLPLTTSGKVRRSECRNLFADGDWPGKRAVGRAAAAPVARAS